MTPRRHNSQNDDLLERVRLALKEADGAGLVANETYLRKIAPRDTNGNLAPTNCGSALLYVSALKPRLRKVLLELGEIENSHRGMWYMEKATERMSLYQTDLQGACASKMICDAIARELNIRLKDLGHFWANFRDE